MSTLSPSNPKDIVGMMKYPMRYVSKLVLGWVGLAMMEGARKYGGHNYRVAGVEAGVNHDAIQRHLDAWWEGQDIDPESGIHHLAKLIAAATVTLDGILQGNWVDNRPPRNPDVQGQINAMNAVAKALVEKYPNPKPAFTEKALVSRDTIQPGPSNPITKMEELQTAAQKLKSPARMDPGFDVLGGQDRGGPV